MQQNNTTIKMALPTLWNHFEFFKALLDVLEQHPEAKRDNVEIAAAYDNFPFCVWDGGRIYNNYYHASAEQVASIKSYLNERGIAVRLIFTNPVVEEEHLHDRYCNLVTQICEDPMNELVVNSPLLEEYLRKTYPRYSFISSTTKCNILDDSIKEIETNRYKYICLDYNQNHNFNKLDKLDQEAKNQVEFLCNAVCPPGCPNRKEHYRLNGLFHINFMKTYAMTFCGITTNPLHPCHNHTNILTPEEIANTYAPKGFSMFKLEGRTWPTQTVMLHCIQYLVKPEYHLFILDALLERFPPQGFLQG